MRGNFTPALEIPARMNATDTVTAWRRVGAVAPPSLVDARLQLHHALQIIVSAPISYLVPRPDDSHTNLEWLPDHEALGTNWLTGPSRLRFALHPARLALLAIDEGSQALSRYTLGGHTVDEGVAWLRATLAGTGYNGSKLTTMKHYEIPAHSVAAGRPFSHEPREAFAELARYYANAHELTSRLAAERPGASLPRCWPHHFDLATLITLPATGRGTRTVGVGLSPGDEYYAEPYFYVGPYPHPSADRLKPLGSLGGWHTEGWVGAVLRASELVQLPGDQQKQVTLAFANEAIQASVQALE